MKAENKPLSIHFTYQLAEHASIFTVLPVYFSTYQGFVAEYK